MSTWLKMIVTGGITLAACVSASSNDGADITVEYDASLRERAFSSSRATDAGSMPDARPHSARTVRDAGRAERPSEPRDTTVSEPDAEVESDLDAGFPELAAPILRDCTETLRCDTEMPSSLEECIAVSTNALARATPESRARFIAIAMRCEALRGCDYVSCSRQP